VLGFSNTAIAEAALIAGFNNTAGVASTSRGTCALVTGDGGVGTIGLYDLDTTDPGADPINEEGQGTDPIFGGVVESVF